MIAHPQWSSRVTQLALWRSLSHSVVGRELRLGTAIRSNESTGAILEKLAGSRYLAHPTIMTDRQYLLDYFNQLSHSHLVSLRTSCDTQRVISCSTFVHFNRFSDQKSRLKSPSGEMKLPYSCCSHLWKNEFLGNAGMYRSHDGANTWCSQALNQNLSKR